MHYSGGSWGGIWTSSIGNTWELVINANAWLPPPSYRIRSSGGVGRTSNPVQWAIQVIPEHAKVWEVFEIWYSLKYQNFFLYSLLENDHPKREAIRLKHPCKISFWQITSSLLSFSSIFFDPNYCLELYWLATNSKRTRLYQQLPVIYLPGVVSFLQFCLLHSLSVCYSWNSFLC